MLSIVFVHIPASTYVKSALVPKVLKKPVHPLSPQISTIMNSSASTIIPIPPAYRTYELVQIGLLIGKYWPHNRPTPISAAPVRASHPTVFHDEPRPLI